MLDRPTVVLFDARCLQDPGFRHRGIGQHAATLVAGARTALPGQRLHLAAITDPRFPPLLDEFADLFDEIRADPDPTPVAAPTWFVQLSPMTHAQSRFARMLAAPGVFKAAVFYDSIPAEMAQTYLTRAERRLDYLANTAWLGRHDHFAPISEHARIGLGRLLGRSPAPGAVSGVAVRAALTGTEPPLSYHERRHVLVASGGDPRKNAEFAVKALAASPAFLATGLPIVVFGGIEAGAGERMRAVLAAAGADPARLRISGHLTDAGLRDLYRTARLTIVPSLSEGFSIPVTESNAAGTPVLLSEIGAHLELFDDPTVLFDPTDASELRGRLEELLADAGRWETVRRAQEGMWRRFEAGRVAARFWTDLRNAAGRAAPAAPVPLKGRLPSIAFISPMSPTVSGISIFSERCLAGLVGQAEMHVFSDAPGAATRSPHHSGLEPISARAFTSRDFDSVIAVMGNSHHHLKTFHLLSQHGGACISHDVRMLDFYVHLLGLERAQALATREMQAMDPHAKASLDDVRAWLDDPGRLPVPLLSELRDWSEPFFVHSPLTARMIEQIGGRPAIALPFAMQRDFDLSRLVPDERARARARLGYAPDEIVVTSFGFLTNDKALPVVVWAAEVLASWGYKVRLVFCGSGPEAQCRNIRWLAREADIEDRVTVFDRSPDEAVFNDHLLASDAAVQLRTYFLGSISGALSDCIGAALPVVANQHLADAIQAPDFIRRVPDHLSPVLVAEELAAIFEAGVDRLSLRDQVRDYRAAHSFEAYNRQLLTALGFEPARPAAARTAPAGRSRSAAPAKPGRSNRRH